MRTGSILAAVLASTFALAVPASSTAADAGGLLYDGSAADAPPATPSNVSVRRFSLSPETGVAGRQLDVRVELARAPAPVVQARVVFSPQAGGTDLKAALGRLSVGRLRTVRMPDTRGLAADRYDVRLHIRSPRGRWRLTAVLVLDVVADEAHAGAGVFPVAGPHSYGEPFGVPRKDHVHQGQDLPAAKGTPVVAPQSGTIAAVAFQAGAAGEYIVEHGAGGFDFFFAHCQRYSTAVAAGDRVAAGARLCNVGATGDAQGPHLHFEMWADRWRTGPASHPVDPLASLQAWER